MILPTLLLAVGGGDAGCWPRAIPVAASATTRDFSQFARTIARSPKSAFAAPADNPSRGRLILCYRPGRIVSSVRVCGLGARPALGRTVSENGEEKKKRRLRRFSQ